MRLFHAVTLAAVSLLGLVGCGGPGPQMRVGFVNTARIVQENPKYLELNILLMQEREAVYSQIPQNVRDLSSDEKHRLQQKLAKEASERSGRFDNLVRDFMQKLQADIKESATQIADNKNLDVVIINTPYFPTIHYTSGEDITTDILLKMHGGAPEVKP